MLGNFCRPFDFSKFRFEFEKPIQSITFGSLQTLGSDSFLGEFLFYDELFLQSDVNRFRYFRIEFPPPRQLLRNEACYQLYSAGIVKLTRRSDSLSINF